ncbi:MAG TPA: hypothetical protein VGL89_11170 [Candidatus Koribacter sp.]
MKPHLYLRAYMAGAFVPTLVVVLVLAVYTILRYGTGVTIPLEKGIIFPIALVPNIWSLWNVLYTRLHQRHRFDIGWYGALLPFLLAPVAAFVASATGILSFREQVIVLFGEVRVPYGTVGVGFACALILYYFVWKYLVGFLNEVVGVA